MKKLLALGLVVVMMLATLTACGKDKETSGDIAMVKENKKLVIGITLYEPMNYYDGNTLVGFDTEFAKLVCEKLGVTATFQEIDWKTKEVTLKAKDIDCIWNGLTVTEERKADMDFSKAYSTNKQVLVINKKDIDTYKTTDDLKAALVSA